MAEIESTKKRPNKFTDIFRIVAAATGGVCSGGGTGSIILWGGGLAVATAITAFSIMINKKKGPRKAQGEVDLQSVDPRKRMKNNCSTAMMIRVIEDECINGFRLALHNPSPLHHHAWSPYSLSKMEIEGQEIVSTQYLISDEKIVLQVKWRRETTASSKEEIVIFDNLQTRKITSSDHNHSHMLDLEQSALQMLTTNDIVGKDPLGTIIQTIKDNRKALEHIISAKQAPGEVEEHSDGDGDGDGKRAAEQIEESTMEEKETGKDGYKEDGNEETGEVGSAFIPIGDAKAGILQQTIYKMRMQIWVFLVVVVMLILLASPKLLTY